jgi:hypothetical protein
MTLLRLLDDVVVAGQRPIPIGVQLVAQRRHSRWVEPVDPSGTRHPIRDQTRVLEHLEVLGDGRSADGELLGKLADRTWPLGQDFDDAAPGGVSERPPRDVLISVSAHER